MYKFFYLFLDVVPDINMAARKKPELTDSWKENIRASMLMKRLEDHYLGKLEKPLDSSQIKAAEVILARLVPTLSAVEQTVVNTADAQSEGDILSNLNALLTAHPGLLDTLIAMRQAKSEPDPVPTAH